MESTDNASGLTKALLHTTDMTVDVNYASAVYNIKRQVNKCIPRSNTSYNYSTSMPVANVSVTKYQTSVKQVSSKKTEVTFKAEDSTMAMQPEGGFIIFGADITRTKSNKAHIKAASGFTLKNLHEALIGWSKGSKSCYDINGAPKD